MKIHFLKVNSITSLLLCTFLLLGFNFTVKAQNVEVKELDYGLYKSETVGETKAKGSPSGKRLLSNDVTFYQTTDTVPIVFDMQFGVVLEIISKSKKPIEFDVIWTYPKPIVNDKGKTFENSLTKMVALPNGVTYTGYRITDHFEMVPGTWKLELKYKGKIVYTKEFELIE